MKVIPIKMFCAGFIFGVSVLFWCFSMGCVVRLEVISSTAGPLVVFGRFL
jgi:hypothetical protein